MIDAALKRCLGQAMHAIHVVGARYEGSDRLFTSHWVMQVSFEEPVVIASVSPKHDTHRLIKHSGAFSVSMLAGDQVMEGQYFSYPGRKFVHIADDFVTEWEGLPVVPNAIAWMRCEVVEQIGAGAAGRLDHDLFLARVTAVAGHRLKEPPLLYSSRLGWRIAGAPARTPGTSVRDLLLARLTAAGIDPGAAGDADTDD